MVDTINRLDFLINVMRETAFAECDQKDVVSKLLEGAKQFIELAERITNKNNEIGNLFFPCELDLMAESKLRFQEDHVSPAIQQKLAVSLYKIRRIRDNIFLEDEIFGDPAWDILLDLVYSEREHKSVSVTSACLAASVPPTTALRWITVLESRGYVERVQDKLDGRRRYVMLTDKGRTFTNRFFAQVVKRQLVVSQVVV